MKLFTDSDLDGVRFRIELVPACRGGWKQFSARMEEFTPGRVTEWREARDAWRAKGEHQFTYMNLMRIVARHAARLAFHYRIGASESSAETSEVFLDWLGEVREWRAQGARNGWASDLWTAEIAAACGMAVDLLGDRLGPGRREAHCRTLLSRGVEPVFREWLEPDTRIHALDSMGHNWWAVCVAGAATGLFAAREFDPEAGQRLDRAADALIEFFAYPGNVLQNKHRTFGAQGDFIESLGYLDYTLESLVPLFEAFRSQRARDLPRALPMLEAVCDYCMASVQPLRHGIQRVNFGDMGPGPESTGGYCHDPSPLWLWLSREYGRADLFHLATRVHPLPRDILSFLYWPDEPLPGGFEGAPGDRVFENVGVAILRDGYTAGSTLLAVKTGETWNHNQSDAGTFILSSRGVEFLVDPGTTEYSNPLHAAYFKRGFAHNVVLHGERDQAQDLDLIGTKFPGRIAGSLFAPGYKYLLADATGPWEGVYRRFYRHFLWFDHTIVLLDDLMAWHEGSWTSLFHHAGEATLRPDGFDLLHCGERFHAHFVAPLPEVVEFAAGYRSRQVPNPLKYEYEISPCPYIRARFPAAGAREKLLVLFELPGSDRRGFEQIVGDGITGLRIAREDGTVEVICNRSADGSVMHHNPEIEAGGVRTDAFLAVLWRTPDGAITRFAIHNGSRIHQGEELLLGSLLKGDYLVERRPGETAVHSHLSVPARVALGSPGGAPRYVETDLPSGTASQIVSTP